MVPHRDTAVSLPRLDKRPSENIGHCRRFGRRDFLHGTRQNHLSTPLDPPPEKPALQRRHRQGFCPVDDTTNLRGKSITSGHLMPACFPPELLALGTFFRGKLRRPRLRQAFGTLLDPLYSIRKNLSIARDGVFLGGRPPPKISLRRRAAHHHPFGGQGSLP